MAEAGSVAKFSRVDSKPIQAYRGRNNAQEKISDKNLLPFFENLSALGGQAARIQKWVRLVPPVERNEKNE